MTQTERLEIVNRIESILDGQFGVTELYHQLNALEDWLLEDPGGHARQAIQSDRCADYWEKSGRPEAVTQTAYFREQARRLRDALA